MSRVFSIFAFVIAIISLALNVLMIYKLNEVRLGALRALDDTSRGLDGLVDFTFRDTIRVNQTFTVGGELPFNQDFTVPISTTFPVNTTVHLSTSTPLGAIDVPLNVNTTVPINLQVPVSISRTVPYSFSVPIDLLVPIEIRLRDVGAEQGIKQVKDEIKILRD